jgi:hypothetical protein
VIREWRDHHDNIAPDRQGHACVRTIWVSDKPVGRCGRLSQWIADYGKPLGKRALCEAHAVELITAWSGLEAARREMS